MKDNAHSAAQVVKWSRQTKFKVDRKKLEQLTSVGFPVRKIAKDGLLRRKLHHNTVHKFMAGD